MFGVESSAGLLGSQKIAKRKKIRSNFHVETLTGSLKRYNFDISSLAGSKQTFR